LFIGLGVRGVVTTQRFLATASTADGAVVDVDSDTHEETTDYNLVVRFVTASGQVVQFRSAEGHSPPPESVGDSVRVLYDPANPQRARLDTWGGRWAEDTAKIIIGMVFFSLGAVILVGALFFPESTRARRGRRGNAAVRGRRRRPHPTPPRPGAAPNRPPQPEPAPDRPRDSKVQDE
jgi:hypothetical protein